MKKSLILCLALLLIAFSASAASMQKGLYEIKVDGSYDLTDVSSDDDVVNIQGGLGYYFTDGFLVGFLMSFSPDTPEGSYWGPDDVWGLGAFAEYNFNISESIVPFIGVSALSLSADDDESSTVAIFTGIKIFITDSVSISAQLNGNFAGDDIYDVEQIGVNTDGSAEKEGEESDFSASLGLRFLL